MKKISFGWLSIAYIVTVLSFAILYLLAWDRSPDHFIINQEFNLFPMGELRNLIESDQATNVQSGVRSHTGVYQSAEVQQKVADLMREKVALGTEANELNSQLVVQQAANRQATEQDTNAWHRNVDAYRDKELATILEEGAKLTNAHLAAQSRANATKDAIERLPLVGAESAAAMDLAKYRVRLAEKQYEVYSRIVADYGSFRDSLLGAQSDKRRAELQKTEEAIGKNMRAQADFRGKVWDYSDSLRMQHINRLGFVDFLYFSLGVSTTTTFGDIIPNSRAVRFMVIVQLVICIVIVGLFVTQTGNKILRD